MERRGIWAAFEMAVLLLTALLVVEAQAQDTACLSRLAPCLNYLNGTHDPPSACCDPLKSVISSDPKCLCGLISNQGANQAKQAGINVTEAQELPGRCGQHVNPIACLSGQHQIFSFSTRDVSPIDFTLVTRLKFWPSIFQVLLVPVSRTKIRPVSFRVRL